MNVINGINVYVISETGSLSWTTISNPSDGPPLDQFCRWLVKNGYVEDIKYTREFSVVNEVTKELTQ